jgi:hypothetical protein
LVETNLTLEVEAEVVNILFGIFRVQSIADLSQQQEQIVVIDLE